MLRLLNAQLAAMQAQQLEQQRELAQLRAQLAARPPPPAAPAPPPAPPAAPPPPLQPAPPPAPAPRAPPRAAVGPEETGEPSGGAREILPREIEFSQDPLSLVDQAKDVANALRERARDPDLAPETLARVQAAIGQAEGAIRDLQGFAATPQHKWTEGEIRHDGTVILGGWTPGANAHEEVRRFGPGSGEAFLGYLENRPAILGILSARPGSGLGVAAGRAQAPQEVIDRIWQTPAVQQADADRQADLAAAFIDAWEWCEYDDGCDLEMEVDFDSAPE
jgi:hypothetical protein